MSIIKLITDKLFENKRILEWDFQETLDLKKIGEKLLGKELTFENLKQIRVYLGKCAAKIPKLTFADP